MARQLAFNYKRGETISTSPIHIQFDEDTNGRAFHYGIGDLSDLLDDLRDGKGIITPIWVRPIETFEGQGLQLVAGQRRLLAALQYLQENPDYLIKALIVEPKTDLDALEMNAFENAGRKGLSIIDQGHIALRLREEPTREGGRTPEQIAKVLRCSPAQVIQSLRLVELLPERAQLAIHEGRATADAAFTIFKVEDPKRRNEMIDEFIINPKPFTPPQEPVGQADRPRPEDAPTKEPTVREAAREAGAKLSLRMPEFRKYLQEAIDEEGPGSNLGEIKLKKKLLEFLDGKVSQRTIDDWFNKLCKMKGE